MTNSSAFHINCYLDTDHGRDVEILLPIVIFAERFLGCKVRFRFLWDFHSLQRDRPDLVMIPNIKGHHLYFQLGKLCYEQGIPVYAHESEGNFRTDGSFPYWGYNLDEFFYQEWVCCWSERTQHYLNTLAPSFTKKIVTTGAPGFDRYRFARFSSRQQLLARWGKQAYQKVVGYAGWAFGKIYSQHKDIALTYIHPDPKKRFKWVEDNRQYTEDLLRSCVEKYTDTLFVFKRHPKEIFEHESKQVKNEMNGLVDYPNVLYIIDEEPIHDLIAISDIWMGFETTTSLEAWLLQKPTIVLNKDTNFTRNNIYKGSAIASNANELHSMIDEYYEQGKVSAFEQPALAQVRAQIVFEAIGSADGLNHVRSAFLLKKSIRKASELSKPEHIKVGWYFTLFYYFYHLFKFVYSRRVFSRLPKFRKTVFIFEKWRLRGLPVRQEELKGFLDDFYQQKRVNADKVEDPAWWKQLFADFPTTLKQLFDEPAA